METVNYKSVRPVQGSRSPNSGKEGFGVKQPPFPATPVKGALSQESPFLCRAPQGKWGFLTQKTLCLDGGKWGFLETPKPSFPHLGDFDPCAGPTDSQTAIFHVCQNLNWPTNRTGENRTGEPRPLHWTLSWALPWICSWDVSWEVLLDRHLSPERFYLFFSHMFSEAQMCPRAYRKIISTQKSSPRVL